MHTIHGTFIDFKSDLIINTSAYTVVDGAETNVEMANCIKASAPSVTADTASALKAAFIHYSTDHVFDGKIVSYIPGKITPAHYMSMVVQYSWVRSRYKKWGERISSYVPVVYTVCQAKVL